MSNRIPWMGQQVETGVLPALFAGRVGEFAERALEAANSNVEGVWR